MDAGEVLGLLPRRYTNVAAEATYNDDLPDALFRTYARLCGLAWQDTLHHHTHLPQLSLEDLAILCHRQAHAMSLHLRQLRNLGLITYVGNKNGYLIRILDPSRAEVSPAEAEQSSASTEQRFASPMMYDDVDDTATGSRTQQQQQQHQAEQSFASTEQRFASTEQSFASTEQTEARIRANLAALSAWGVNPATAPARAVAAFPHLTPELIHAWGADLQQRAQVRNLPGLLLYTLRTTTQWPRAETRGGTRGALSAAELPPSAQAPLPVAAAPGLPEDVLADLAELGWTGAVDEVLTYYAADPDRVLDWLAYWLGQNGTSVRSRAALFRQSLRSGASAPSPVEPLHDSGERYISGEYANFIQH